MQAKAEDSAALEAARTEYRKVQMSGEQLQELKETIEQAKRENWQEKSQGRAPRYVAAALAAAALVFVIVPNTSAAAAYAMEKLPIIGSLVRVVTFRDYEYEDERNRAVIDVPKIEVEQADTEGLEEDVREELEKSTEEINAEIEEISGRLVQEFKASMENEMGYQDLMVQSEVLATTQDYFTLKLLCYQGAGSGYQFNYYYTIDLNTGERLKLKDLFAEGADYITPISDNIKEQMRAQMAADENVIYWLDQEVEEWNFQSITEDVSFYLNENNNVVIGFNEGDVAPMYMGTVEFEIPADILENIRK
ncbi:MAG: DUF3298 domain-containing protein [Lachnospiraceae bacterium]|nr:DUF3298 domain-containing protein [Lachnospiraceae bacterium]